MKRFFYYSIFCLAGLFLLATTLLLTTEIGLKITLDCLPGKAKADYISGSLLNGWTMKNVDYQNASIHIFMGEMHFSWQASRLLKQDVVVNNLQINHLDITITTPPEESASSAYNFNLPINIYLEKSNIHDIHIVYNKKDYTINHFQARAALVNNNLMVNKLIIKTPDVYTTSAGNIDLAKFTTILLKNQLIFNDYPHIPIMTLIQGDRNSLTLESYSKKWLSLNVTLNHYFDGLDNTSFQAQWSIDAGKAGFKELKNLNGALHFSGKASGKLLQPAISSQLFMKNIRYDTYTIGDLKSALDFSLDQKNNIHFSLAGKNIALGETSINTLNTQINGTTFNHTVFLKTNFNENNTFSFSSQNKFFEKKYFITQGKFNTSFFTSHLYPISMTIDFNKDRDVTYEAQIQHDKEKLSVTGSAQFDSGNVAASAHIISHKFTPIDSEYYTVTASPNLTVTYHHNETHVDGNVTVIDARVAPIDFSNTITTSNDIVYTNNRGEPLHKSDASLKLFLNVAINIQKFFIDYKGVKATIYGDLHIKQTPETEISGLGQLKFLKGSYKAYGQELTIQKDSHINFTQAIDNPQLNITAEKEVKVSPEYISLPTYQPYLIIGAQVTGTVEQPKILLFSIPAGVSQQDILSYLLFGMPQKQLSGSQMSLLWSALTMVGSSNGSNSSLLGLQRSIQKSLGFSEFGLGSTSEYNATTQQYETGTAFVIGKQITENLIATYNIGLLVPVNVLYLRYKLSQRWALQTDSSVLGNGADIFYTISTD